MTPKPDLSEFEALTEAEDLRRQITTLQERLRKANAKTADLVKAAHEGARDAAVLLGNPPPVAASARDRRKGDEEVALLHLSDWQLGKRSESYNSQVACERVERLGEKIVRLTEIERADHPVRDLHAMLGGDLIEGATIFPGQQYEIDAGLFEQVFTTIGALERILRVQLGTYERVHVWEQTGNHGRIGRKGDRPREDNADLFVYREARARLADYESDGRLVWHPRDNWYTIVTIGEYRALLVHGDQIKSFGGNIPAFGIYRKVNGWASGVLPPFQDCYLGHFHQPLVLPLANGKGRAFVNPSLESDSAYAQEFVAATGTPGQRLHFIDPLRGRITTERLLYAEDE